MSSWGSPAKATLNAHSVLLDVAVVQIRAFSDDLAWLYSSFPSLRSAMVQSWSDALAEGCEVVSSEALAAARRERPFHRGNIVVLGDSYGRAALL